MPLTEWGWQVTPGELASWIVHDDADVLAINKPGLVVCHPSKHGPWSSLIGACREYLGVERLHMPSRLDRETSGVVVFAKHAEAASVMQKAIQSRNVAKTYFAILRGELGQPVEVDQPIGQHPTAGVVMRRAIVAEGQAAQTRFEPVHSANGFTIAQVQPHTGRMHQIRVHAEWLGHPIVGDKIYGGDETIFLRFITAGLTPELNQELELPRHALHASRLAFDLPSGPRVFDAPFPSDLKEFCARHQIRFP